MLNDYSWQRIRQLTAVHEGGHCGAAWYMGAVLREVTLFDVDRGACRHNHSGLNWCKHNSVEHEEVKAAILINLSGIAAVTRKAMQIGEPSGIWDTDRRLRIVVVTFGTSDFV